VTVNVKWLEDRLNERGISRWELRKKVGLHWGTVLSWNQGRTPRMHTLRKIADAIGMDYQTLVRGLGIVQGGDARGPQAPPPRPSAPYPLQAPPTRAAGPQAPQIPPVGPRVPRTK
jgi:hypothetical protein